MKKIFVMIGLILISLNLLGQSDNQKNTNFKPELRWGVMYNIDLIVNSYASEEIANKFFNEFSSMSIYEFRNIFSTNNAGSLGYNVEVLIPSKYKELKYKVSGFIMAQSESVNNTNINNWDTYGLCKENGGGIYIGPEISYNFNNTIGINGSASLGYFSFVRKYYINMVDWSNEPTIHKTLYDKESHPSLGGVLDAGLIINLGPVSIMPNFYTMVTSSKNGAFFNYTGLNAKLGFKF